MELMKAEVKDLAILDTDVVLDGELAWNVAQFISDVESDVRLAKGKFWNRCKHGTREDICDNFGWSYRTMQEYGYYATEIPATAGISFTHWRNAKDAGLKAADRPEWLQQAADNKWTPKELKGEVVEHQKTVVKEIKGRNLKRDIKNKVVPKDTTLEDYDERRHKAYDEEVNWGRSIPRKTSTHMTLAEACEVFGLSQISWMTEETLDILYKGYSRILHPDVVKDDGVAMQLINRAKEVIKKIVR